MNDRGIAASSNAIEALPKATNCDVVEGSVESLVASLVGVRASSQALLASAARASAAEAALALAAVELDEASRAIEEAGRALNSALHVAAIAASRGGAQAACAVLDPSGALLESLRGVGASVAHTNSLDDGPMETAKVLVREAVGISSDALTMGVLLSTLALQADPREIALTLETEHNEGVLQYVSAAAARLQRGDQTTNGHSMLVAAPSPMVQHHTLKPTGREPLPVVNTLKPTGREPLTVMNTLKPNEMPMEATVSSPRASVGRRSARTPREWTISMPVAVAAVAVPSPISTPSLPILTRSLTTAAQPPQRASTPLRQAMRAAADICATAACAVAALDASVQHGGWSNASVLATPTMALTSVPRFAAVLSASAIGGEEAGGAGMPLTRLRATAADHAQLARQRGSESVRGALGSIRGSLSIEFHVKDPKTDEVSDEISVLAGLGADLIAIEKLLLKAG